MTTTRAIKSPCKKTNGEFTFIDSVCLTDGEIKLTLRETAPEDREVGLPSYRFAITEAATGVPVGTISLRVGYNRNVIYYGNVGYEVLPRYRGRHIARRSVWILTRLAREHGMKSLVITCDPDNAPSRRTCERLGARFIGVVPVPPSCDLYARGERHKCVFELEL